MHPRSPRYCTGGGGEGPREEGKRHFHVWGKGRVRQSGRVFVPLPLPYCTAQRLERDPPCPLERAETRFTASWGGCSSRTAAAAAAAAVPHLAQVVREAVVVVHNHDRPLFRCCCCRRYRHPRWPHRRLPPQAAAAAAAAAAATAGPPRPQLGSEPGCARARGLSAQLAPALLAFHCSRAQSTSKCHLQAPQETHLGLPYCCTCGLPGCAPLLPGSWLAAPPALPPGVLL